MRKRYRPASVPEYTDHAGGEDQQRAELNLAVVGDERVARRQALVGAAPEQLPPAPPQPLLHRLRVAGGQGGDHATNWAGAGSARA
ncbi:hypothetical protein TSOC_006223 [Tetrabaena socialis]|uniref:Uncharacterized protein n=1 Tax=Tetrabaena socialis TaxID=47790 RepID=A0A2J8A497_9CHLO|nr:hypothetical protein TSOC_006223 [Tetrabaena socialis]|eukprot:PNH07328.1 hypothetical protein TSOC_006223 [Tetrabaena socialis]